MQDEVILQLLKELNAKGIQLHAIYEPIGCDFCLKASDVPAFLKDRIQFFASECGLSREDYVEWREYVKSGCHCGASIKTGTCSRQINSWRTLKPHEYFERKKAGTLLCSRHLPKPDMYKDEDD